MKGTRVPHTAHNDQGRENVRIRERVTARTVESALVSTYRRTAISALITAVVALIIIEVLRLGWSLNVDAVTEYREAVAVFSLYASILVAACFTAAKIAAYRGRRKMAQE